ncbi:hypothetical protein PHMEG_00022326 [Phytophthora megakarya]|uniref:Uncharacterized protein n=1 Tax=Phytophthora megakarya TaxID=4795 RepID=A0A225VJ17_9STRA|nr:hypothetical protein PHMEG_00022326 [Phytophthora megakarya]
MERSARTVSQHEGVSVENLLATLRRTCWTARTLCTARVRFDSDGFEWPRIRDIIAAQSNRGQRYVVGIIYFEWQKRFGYRSATGLLQRLMIIVPCGANGHRGMHVMANNLGRGFSVNGPDALVRKFCQQSLLCLHVKGGDIIPKPFSETHHTFERNATLHWDFLTLGESYGTTRYVLVLKDEVTHFVELVPCNEPTSEVAAAAIWIGIVGLAYPRCGSVILVRILRERWYLN